VSIKQRRTECERKAQEAKEEERRKKEREAIQEANQKLIKQLESGAGAWHRARYLRRYISFRAQAARKSRPAGELSQRDGGLSNMGGEVRESVGSTQDQPAGR
jgi:hypothetical protein